MTETGNVVPEAILSRIIQTIEMLKSIRKSSCRCIKRLDLYYFIFFKLESRKYHGKICIVHKKFYSTTHLESKGQLPPQ